MADTEEDSLLDQHCCLHPEAAVGEQVCALVAAAVIVQHTADDVDGKDDEEGDQEGRAGGQALGAAAAAAGLGRLAVAVWEAVDEEMKMKKRDKERETGDA